MSYRLRRGLLKEVDLDTLNQEAMNTNDVEPTDVERAFDIAVGSMATATETVATQVVSRMYAAAERHYTPARTIGGHVLAVAVLLIIRAAELGVPRSEIEFACRAALDPPLQPTKDPH